MTILYNKIELKPIRKELRKNQTKTEEIFWNKVRNKQFHGLKFRRQHSVGRYVLDFYYPYIKLCIEIDGENHLENINKENYKIRTEYIGLSMNKSFKIYKQRNYG